MKLQASSYQMDCDFRDLRRSQKALLVKPQRSRTTLYKWSATLSAECCSRAFLQAASSWPASAWTSTYNANNDDGWAVVSSSPRCRRRGHRCRARCSEELGAVSDHHPAQPCPDQVGSDPGMAPVIEAALGMGWFQKLITAEALDAQVVR